MKYNDYTVLELKVCGRTYISISGRLLIRQ